MKVEEIMTRRVIVVNETATLLEVAQVMLDNGIGCVPVVDQDGKMSGIITHQDFTAKEKTIPFTRFRSPHLFGQWLQEGSEKVYQAAQTLTAKDIMSVNPITLTENDLVKTFLEKLIKYKITHIPILRGETLVGIVARQDLLKLLVGKSGPPADSV